MADPRVLNLSNVARYLAIVRADMDDHGTVRTEGIYYAVLDVWEGLTGLTGPEALAYAEQCRTTTTTAVIPPF